MSRIQEILSRNEIESYYDKSQGAREEMDPSIGKGGNIEEQWECYPPQSDEWEAVQRLPHY